MTSTVASGGNKKPYHEQYQMGDEPATPTMAITGNGGKRVAVTEENLPRMKNVVIMQNEGIVYCPVAKARKTSVEKTPSYCCCIVTSTPRPPVVSP